MNEEEKWQAASEWARKFVGSGLLDDWYIQKRMYLLTRKVRLHSKLSEAAKNRKSNKA